MTVAHTIPSACATYGVGRTKLYDLMRTGAVRVRRFGKRTLIEDASMREWFASLPQGLDVPAFANPGRRRTASDQAHQGVTA